MELLCFGFQNDSASSFYLTIHPSNPFRTAEDKPPNAHISFELSTIGACPILCWPGLSCLTHAVRVSTHHFTPVHSYQPQTNHPHPHILDFDFKCGIFDTQCAVAVLLRFLMFVDFLVCHYFNQSGWPPGCSPPNKQLQIFICLRTCLILYMYILMHMHVCRHDYK